MARFFKCYGPDHPLFEPVYKAFGTEGYGVAVMVIAQADAQGLYQIDEDRLARWAHIRKPKAIKMIDLIKQMLVSYRSIVQQSGSITQQYSDTTEQYPSIVEQSDCTTAVHTPSNPGGCIKEERIERIDKREERENPEPVGSAPVQEKPKFEERHMNLAQELWEIVHERWPYYKQPDLGKWAREVRLLEEEGFSIEEIEDVARWALFESDFWPKQIRSAPNLRKHFRKILDQSGLYPKWEKRRNGN